jgi:hypothetical protein
MDVGHYRHTILSVDEMSQVISAIGDVEQSKNIMISSGIDSYKYKPKHVVEQSYFYFAAIIYTTNLDRILQHTRIRNLTENKKYSPFIKAICSLFHACKSSNDWQGPLLELYKFIPLLHLASYEQLGTVKKDLKTLKETDFYDSKESALALKPINRELDIIISNSKNALSEARKGTLLTKITDDVFHHTLLTQFDCPLKRTEDIL